MSARDDYPTLAAAADLVSTAVHLGIELTAALREIDDLRSRHGATSRIEALRARSRAAEDLVSILARALRPQATVEARQTALAAHREWLMGERVA